MKNLGKLLVLILFIFGINAVDSFGQKKGESVITAGVGIGYLNLGVSLEGANNQHITTSAIPTLNFIYDLGLLDNFSMGIYVGYNSISRTEEHVDYNFPNPTSYTTSEDNTRLNIGLRPLIHWGKKEELDWHAGVRLGYSIWTSSFSSTVATAAPKYPEQNLYSFQVLVGTRAYFTDKLGFTVDLGIGTPYFVGIGFSVKLYCLLFGFLYM